MRIIIPLTLLLFFSLFASAHPIKMSTGRLDFDLSSGSCTLLLNFFIDDFEPALRQRYPQPLFDFDMPSNQMSASIENYISKNISISIDGSTLVMHLLSLEKIEDNVCQVSLVVNFPAGLKRGDITVLNSLLFDTYSKQSNVLHVFVSGELATILQFYPSSAKKSFSFGG